MSSIRFVHADQRRRFRAAALGAWVLGVVVLAICQAYQPLKRHKGPRAASAEPQVTLLMKAPPAAGPSSR